MDPTPEELENIVDLDGCCAWAGVDGDLRTALMGAIGDPARLREIALIPRQVWDASVTGLVLGQPPMLPTPITPVQAARVESVRRVCMLRMGRPTDGPGDPGVQPAANPPAPFPAAGGPATGSPQRKLKLSAVLDPCLDAEITVLSEAEISQMYTNYKVRFGDFPTADSDVSRDQLSALAQVLASSAAPYADFSVFGPYGQRLLRRQTYMGYQLSVATGEWIKKGLPGPSDFHAWYKTWKCFRTAMLLLEACEAERLDGYSEFIRGQVQQFGEEAWGFISKADTRLRSEHLDRIRRKLRAEPQFGFTEASPWSACFAASVRETEFWSKELTTPATLYLARNKRESADKDDEAPRSSGPLKKKTRAARRFSGEDKSKKGEDGRYSHNRKGIEICRAYNSNKCGTEKAQGKCRGGRSHQCNLCLGPHQAVGCKKD